MTVSRMTCKSRGKLLTDPQGFLPVAIGDRLAELREQNGLSQEDAAAMVGITLRQWQRWERGQSEPYKRNLARLSAAFKVPISHLFDEGPASSAASQLDRIEAKLDELLDRHRASGPPGGDFETAAAEAAQAAEDGPPGNGRAESESG